MEQAVNLCSWAQIQDLLEGWKEKVSSGDAPSYQEIWELTELAFQTPGNRQYAEKELGEIRTWEELAKKDEKVIVETLASRLEVALGVITDEDSCLPAIHLNSWLYDSQTLIDFRFGVAGDIVNNLWFYLIARGKELIGESDHQMIQKKVNI